MPNIFIIRAFWGPKIKLVKHKARRLSSYNREAFPPAALIYNKWKKPSFSALQRAPSSYKIIYEIFYLGPYVNAPAYYRSPILKYNVALNTHERTLMTSFGA